eukprot:scaffold234_cov406-Prasinococcus_capsulatus_cf.AAC.8
MSRGGGGPTCARTPVTSAQPHGPGAARRSRTGEHAARAGAIARAFSTHASERMCHAGATGNPPWGRDPSRTRRIDGGRRHACSTSSSSAAAPGSHIVQDPALRTVLGNGHGREALPPLSGEGPEISGKG